MAIKIGGNTVIDDSKNITNVSNITASGTVSLGSNTSIQTTTSLTNIRPSLNLDFANSKTLDPKITFTRSSTGTYTDYDGLIKSVAVDKPRFDHDPVTGQCKGLLIEESRTNLLTYSEQFDNAAWTKSNATVTANATTAPDGTVTADKLVENTTNDYHNIQKNSISTTNGQYTITVYAKAAERSRLDIGSWDGSTGNDCIFNLLTGVVDVTGAGATASMSSVGGGWYRCSVTRNVASATLDIYFYLDSGVSGNVSNYYLGNGVSGLYIWGAQLEAGAFATSYIPTTSTSLTRSADIASITGTNFSSWYNQSEGSLVIDSTINYSIPSGQFPCLASINDTTYSNRIVIFEYLSGGNKINYTGTISSVTQWNLDSGSTIVVQNQSAKISATYKLNDIADTVNGITVLSDTTATIPVVTRIDIGSQINSNYLNGTIANLSYYPKRLTNTDLQILSTQ